MHYTLVTSLPTFMKEVLHYDIKQVHALILLCYDAKDWKKQVLQDLAIINPPQIWVKERLKFLLVG